MGFVTDICAHKSYFMNCFSTSQVLKMRDAGITTRLFTQDSLETVKEIAIENRIIHSSEDSAEISGEKIN